MRRLRLLSTCIAMSLALNACAQSQAPAQPATSAEPARSMPTQAGTLQVRPIASGLEHPWAVALLPGGDFLVTERPGRLRRIAANGTPFRHRSPVSPLCSPRDRAACSMWCLIRISPATSASG
jgi:glucose/arabinose dehydrogenase